MQVHEAPLLRTGGGRLVEAELWLWEPAADGNIALRWAKEAGGGATGPTLKKGSWLRANVT